ncbi:MAG: hypothetical protein L3K08_02745 [Thermoplasmata archaeon]|nr:hypothetical protein [Thermoplasmata archaeon]
MTAHQAKTERARMFRTSPLSNAPAPRRRAPTAPRLLAPIVVIGVLLLVGAAGVLTAAPSQVERHLAGGVPTAQNPSALLASARASAARGHGPWGPVSSTQFGPRGSTGPNLTFGVVMTYDAADGYVLAVSLNASAGPFNNTYGPTDLTWKFAGGNWSLLNTTGQVPATLSPGLVFDGHDQYVLLYGGRLMATSAAVAPLTNQTWSYRAGVWTNLSGNSTAAPWSVDFANPVYDAADEYVLLYNEIGITPTDPNGYYNTTWTYAAGVWTNITAAAGTPPEMLGAMAYDSTDAYVIYFGGYTWWNQLSNSTWAFHHGTWSNLSANVTGAPSPRMNFGIADDTRDGYVVLYGGLVQLGGYNSSAFSYQTWAYAAGVWSLLSTTGTIWSIQSMVYDVADNESVLLGSNSSFAVAPNVVTWVYSAAGWTVAAPVFVRSEWATDVDHAFTFVVSQSLNEGGLQYQYANLPPGCAGANTPTLRCMPSTTGNYSVTVTITGAAGFFARAVTSLRVNPTPSVLSFSGSPDSGEVGIASTITVRAANGTGPLSYAYVGLPPGCNPTNSSVLQCVPTVAGSYPVTAMITDSVGVSVQASDTLPVAAALQVASLSADRSVLDVGQPVAVSTTLTGGVGIDTYGYAGLPTGCGSVDSGLLSCRPSAPGAFSIRADVTDALGARATANEGIVVNPLPTVASFLPSNVTIASGGAISLSTTISGGTAPFQYRYSGLPSGCGALMGATVTCAAVPRGNYSVEVTVTDATGATTTGTTSFVVSTPLAKLGPLPPSQSPALGFWSGFALATIAIAAAALIGGYRLVLARQGRDIVQKLRVADPPSGDAPEPNPSEASTPEDG